MKNPFKRWLLGLVSLFSVLVISGCSLYPVEGTVVEKEHEQGHWETKKRSDGTKYQSWEKECYELDIYDHEADSAVERCVSESVYNDATIGQKITLTEEYH